MSPASITERLAGSVRVPPNGCLGRGITASMTIFERSEELGGHLGELGELFAALMPESELGVGVYDTDGTLLSAYGFEGLPKRLPKNIAFGDQVTVVPQLHVSIATAYGRVEPTGTTAEIVFAVCTGAPTPHYTLASLCRMGAGFLARTIDLIERTRTLTQAVREQEAIIDHISDGLIVLDRSGILRYLNAPGGRILGIDPARGVGRPFRDLLDFEPVIAPIFKTGVGYVDRELQLRSRRIDIHILDTAIPIVGDDGQVVSIVNTFREMSRVKNLTNRLAGDRARYRFSDVIGQSRAIKEAVALGRRAARSNASVLLYGESGTGKEVFAQAIHNEGNRSRGPFVAVNCAALPHDLIESEMFGYSPGSFTGADKAGRPGRFELASSGTLFLDEISEMPLDVQAKFLRVLQERQVTRIGGTSSVAVDVRVIVAANRDLRELVARQAFREDLYYRLDVMRLDLPPLRDRREDIGLLSRSFIARICASLHRPDLVLGETALAQLRAHDWPGNVRQLQNVIERLVNMTDADEAAEIPEVWLASELKTVSASAGTAIGEAMSLEDAERIAIRLALRETRQNVTRAAEVLGITRPTLYAKLRRYGLAAGLRFPEQ